MLNLLELEQLIAFADLGTLSKAAEKLHISQPTLTRTMKNIEAAFGVPLFHRGKNKIELNETGKTAVTHARNLLASAQATIQQVQAFHAKLHTIFVQSCAPAPLWALLPLLAAQFPEQAVSSRLSEQPAIIEGTISGDCEIGILSYPIEIDGLACIPIVEENLFACIPKGHELAGCESLTFGQLNGFNCLLRSQIGFWTGLCFQKMPASKFLIQTDDFSFRELVQNSTLPCFTTNLATDMSDILAGRNKIPVLDAEANVVYYFICKKSNGHYATIAEQLRGAGNLP